VNQLLGSAFGTATERVIMIRHWIDGMWNTALAASRHPDGVRIYVGTETGSRYNTIVSLEDAQVLADYALSVGHPDADKLLAAWRAPLL
jgi:hypothetical protein